MSEDGTIMMVGIGECAIDLPFEPTAVHYKSVDNPHDPGPMSQIPVQQETVEYDIKANPNKPGFWKLIFKWNIFGVKEVYWQASA